MGHVQRVQGESEPHGAGDDARAAGDEPPERSVMEINQRLRIALADVSARESTIRQQAEHLQELNDQLQTTLVELRETQQRVIHQERMRVLAQMASEIAHDLNNALSPVLGFAELLLVRPDSLSDTETARTYLQLIFRGAEDAAAVVRRLAALAAASKVEDPGAALDSGAPGGAPAQTGPPAGAGSNGDAAPSARGLRVLVVDDEPAVRRLTMAFLEAEGHAAEPAGSGDEALQRFRSSHFDVVITDQAMPGMQGDQLAGAIKEQRPDMPILLLTGFGDLMRISGEQPAGVDLVLSKPLTLAQLRDALASIVPRHRHSAARPRSQRVSS